VCRSTSGRFRRTDTSRLPQPCHERSHGGKGQLLRIVVVPVLSVRLGEHRFPSGRDSKFAILDEAPEARRSTSTSRAASGGAVAIDAAPAPFLRLAMPDNIKVSGDRPVLPARSRRPFD
jgi:hypothetical protein